MTIGQLSADVGQIKVDFEQMKSVMESFDNEFIDISD